MPGFDPTEHESGAARLLLQRPKRTVDFFECELSTVGQTFGVVAGFKDVQLMGVVGEGEDFDH